MQRRKECFTLIELMIVVSIIAIIAAIAIPSLLAARISGNEASAISSLRTLSTTQEQYRTRFGAYSSSLTDLQSNNYIDNVLSTGSKSGYLFAGMSATGNTAWSINADPATPGTTGERGFFVDQSGVIRFVTSGSAGAGSSAID